MRTCCYADEVRSSPASREREPFFKPDFSPDLLLSTNYIGRPWFASTALLGRSGVTTRDLLQAGEYDAVLRCAEQAVRVHHVPRFAVPTRCVADRRCGDGGGGIGARRGATRYRGRGAGRCGARHMAAAAHAAGNRHGVDHHPDLRRAGLYRDLHQVAARAHRLSQFRDRLRRQHPGQPGRVEDLAAAERRHESCRCRMRSTGRISTTAAWRRRPANICCS